jgi:16S rRNA (guanine(966)-N(2))-methyltransferase RsmD
LKWQIDSQSNPSIPQSRNPITKLLDYSITRFIVRVIAGHLKGRRLKAPDWSGVRPTSDKLRETLFNIVAPRIAGARVVDGYAGTGAVGIEALSRGARAVTFIDRDARALALVAANLRHCGVATGYTILPGDVAAVLTALGTAAAFDLVFVDPPYGTDPAESSAALAAAGDRLAAGGLVVLERARREAAPERAGRLIRVRDVESGDSALSFYELA